MPRSIRDELKAKRDEYIRVKEEEELRKYGVQSRNFIETFLIPIFREAYRRNPEGTQFSVYIDQDNSKLIKYHSSINNESYLTIQWNKEMLPVARRIAWEYGIDAIMTTFSNGEVHYEFKVNLM